MTQRIFFALTLHVTCHLFVIFLVLLRNLSKVYVSVEMINTAPIILHKAVLACVPAPFSEVNIGNLQ